ncbi:hypothetical protein BDV32DRAFT_128340 [Aspergillus pseudonomiae]|nr:hypothetical protein BDV32DRAFT_128340 [Aspergillus pseudonomiae]
MTQTNGADPGLGDRTTDHDDVGGHSELWEMIALCNLYIAGPSTVIPAPSVALKRKKQKSLLILAQEKPLEADLKPAKQPVANEQNTICPIITQVILCDFNKLRTQKLWTSVMRPSVPVASSHTSGPRAPLTLAAGVALHIGPIILKEDPG